MSQLCRYSSLFFIVAAFMTSCDDAAARAIDALIRPSPNNASGNEKPRRRSGGAPDPGAVYQYGSTL